LLGGKVKGVATKEGLRKSRESISSVSLINVIVESIKPYIHEDVISIPRNPGSLGGKNFNSVYMLCNSSILKLQRLPATTNGILSLDRTTLTFDSAIGRKAGNSKTCFPGFVTSRPGGTAGPSAVSRSQPAGEFLKRKFGGILM